MDEREPVNANLTRKTATIGDLAGANPVAVDVSLRTDRRSRRYVAIVAAVVLVAVLLRFVALDRYPLPLHQDELSDIYDGYSLAMTGADRGGDRWPIIFHGMGPGDYHPGLYVYLAAVTTRIGGFSVWAGRLPAAAAGVLTVVLVFLVARSLLGRRAAVVALLFIAFSPVHILYSRQAHTGGCLPPLFAILVVYLLDRSLKTLAEARRRRVAYAWVTAAGFAIGLSTSAYGAARLSGLLFALFGTGLLVCRVGFRCGAWRRAAIVAVVFATSVGLGAAPQLYVMITQPELFFARASNVVPPLGNGLRWWARKLVINTGLNLDPHHLFFSFGEYRLLTVAGLSIASLPFLYVGLLSALGKTLWRRHWPTALLLGATVICLMPAVVSRPNPNPMRASGVWALYPLVSALGVETLGNVFRVSWIWLTASTRNGGRRGPAGLTRAATVATVVVGMAVAAAGTFYVFRYLQHPEWHGLRDQNRLVALGEWVREHGGGYDRIYVDAPGLFPYLYLAVFSGMPPAEFQRTPREGTVTAFGWEKFPRFGRFRFATTERARSEWQTSDQSQTWVVLTADGEPIEFPP